MSVPVAAAPGVLRRRWSLELMQRRMLEKWQAASVFKDRIVLVSATPSLRSQVEAEFQSVGRKR